MQALTATEASAKLGLSKRTGIYFYFLSLAILLVSAALSVLSPRHTSRVTQAYGLVVNYLATTEGSESSILSYLLSFQPACLPHYVWRAPSHARSHARSARSRVSRFHHDGSSHCARLVCVGGNLQRPPFTTHPGAARSHMHTYTGALAPTYAHAPTHVVVARARLSACRWALRWLPVASLSSFSETSAEARRGSPLV